MRKILFTLVFVFLSAASLVAAELPVDGDGYTIYPLDISKEPKGFRGLKWGQHVNTLKGLKINGEWPFKKRYERAGDKLAIGDAPLLNIWYSFVNDKLAEISVTVGKSGGSFTHEESEKHYKMVRETLFKAYGQRPTVQPWIDRMYRWHFPSVIVTFYGSEEGYITYEYIPAAKELKQLIEQRQKSTDQKVKEQAVQETNDL